MPPRLNLPPVTRALMIGLGVQSLLSAAIRCRQWSADTTVVIPYLTLVPSLSLTYPWTFLTTTLVEGNVFTAGISVFTLYHGGRYLERAWSSEELVKFVAIISLASNILTFLSLVAMFALSHVESWTLTVVSGTIPLQIGFLVAFSQLLPAHTVTIFRGVLSMRMPRFPFLYLVCVWLLAMSPLLSSASFFLAVHGFVVSWTYLRFYKTVFPDLESASSSVQRGDASETFAFAEFFPGPLKPLLRALSEVIFGILVALRICTPFSAADVSAASSRNQSSMARGASGARAEAERRRAIALRALDQRLQAATAAAAAKAQVPPHEQTGPTVLTQPNATQTTMVSKPAEPLDGTNYSPEDQDSGRR
ncbi:Protein pdh1 [Ceratocystis lukuohia]|uniref:Protein pdh1 n=1 Tax=Ceratocystis lukuohia TaxID=2019550 RepID=A0ABR4MSP6_9PEZI